VSELGIRRTVCLHDQLRLLGSHLSTWYAGAGHHDHEGDVRRCYMTTQPLGSILTGDVCLLNAAMPCDADRCGCADLWQYIVK